MGFFRRIVLFLLGIVLILLVPLALLGLWSKSTLLDTDHYVETVGPLASDDAVQTQVRVTIMSFLDNLAAGAGGDSNSTQQLINNEYSSLRPTIESTVTTLLDTPTFRTIWEGINREAHHSLVLLLEGKAPTDDQGRVILDLNKVYDELQTALLADGITILDGIEPSANRLTMPLFQSDELSEVQSYVKLFDRVAIALPVIAILLALLLLWWSPRKLRGFFWIGLVTAIGMGMLVVGLMIGRDATTSSVSDEVTKDALGVVYDEVTSSLSERVLLIGIISLAFTIIAYVAARMTRPRRY